MRLDTDSFHEIARLLFDIKIEGWKTDTTIVLEFADILLNIIADRTANCGARKKSVNIIVPALVLGHPQNEWIFQALLRMTHDPALREIIHAALEGEVGFRMGIAKMDRQDWKTRYPDVKYSNELVSVLDKGSEHPYTDLNPSLMRPGTKLECLLKACEMHASGTCPECEGT